MTRRHREIHKDIDSILNMYQELKVLLPCACPIHACALQNKSGVRWFRVVTPGYIHGIPCRQMQAATYK